MMELLFYLIAFLQFVCFLIAICFALSYDINKTSAKKLLFFAFFGVCYIVIAPAKALFKLFKTALQEE